MAHDHLHSGPMGMGQNAFKAWTKERPHIHWRGLGLGSPIGTQVDDLATEFKRCRLKGLETHGVHFLNLAARVNLACKHHPHAAHLVLDQRAEHPHGVLKIARAIAVLCIKGAHAASEHHRLVLGQ